MLDRKSRRASFLFALFTLPWVVAAARAQLQPPGPPATRSEREAFLSKAAVVGEAALDPAARRVSLDDGRWTHDASVAWRSHDPAHGNYRYNVAAFELDKLLELGLVPPSVERAVNGRPAALVWWVDEFQMDERSRRRREVAPPDPERWAQQLQAVRVFDELIANAYRSMDPAAYSSTVWDNLLITRDWRVRLIDHTHAFGVSRRLQYPESLTRCDRTLLASVRALNSSTLERRLASFLSAEQLDALEARRKLILGHIDERIAQQGESAVLYDLSPQR